MTGDYALALIFISGFLDLLVVMELAFKALDKLRCTSRYHRTKEKALYPTPTKAR